MNKSTVLIIGALTEIGQATAIAFAQNGTNIVVSGRNQEKGDSLVKELENLKIEADYLFADVRHEEDVRNLVDWTNIRFGSLDVAVNIAEIEGESGLLVEQSIENFNDVFEMNVRGTFLSMKHEMRVMLRQKSGVIVNISSTFGRLDKIGSGFYAASRIAIEELTKTAAREAANESVRVNAVAPEPTDSDLISDEDPGLNEGIAPIRLRKLEEIAGTIVFAASDKAPYSTGQIIGINS